MLEKIHHGGTENTEKKSLFIRSLPADVILLGPSIKYWRLGPSSISHVVSDVAMERVHLVSFGLNVRQTKAYNNLL